MQSHPTYTMYKVTQDCLYKEGIRGLYKGMGFPLASVSLLNAIVFSTNEVAKLHLGFNEDSLIEGTITGGIAGLVNSIVVTPVELVKCRLQIQTEDKKYARYKGIIDCLNQIYNEKGIKGLYQGNAATILREVPGYGAQFGTYYFSKNLLSILTGLEIKNLNNLSFMIAGALSGILCWVASFPQDVIKTNIQLDIEGNKFVKNKYLFDGGFIDCSKYIYRKDGKNI